MKGKILQITAQFLLLPLVLVSLWVFLRGHNAPGGGFIGGLIGAVAFALFLITHGSSRTKALLPFDPRSLIGIGLLVAIASALYPIYRGESFFQGQWLELSLPWIGGLTLGTPLLFDLGVYLVVIGTLMIILFSLWEE